LARPASVGAGRGDTLLLKHIEQIHVDSRRTYGWPRVHAELVLGMGLSVNRKRVARLMRQAGLQGLYRRRRRRGQPRRRPRKTWSTGSSPSPSRTGCGSPTFRSTRLEGKLYVAAVMDAWSRRIIGWSIAEHMRTELVIDVLGMATLRRQPPEKNTILHSDHGTQYTSWAFGQRLRAAGLHPSMGTIGDCYDNSMMESFWGTLQLEIFDTKTWETRADLANAIFEWIECWYNPERRHSSIGMLSPTRYEATHPPQPST
jgi:putative transposase